MKKFDASLSSARRAFPLTAIGSTVIFVAAVLLIEVCQQKELLTSLLPTSNLTKYLLTLVIFAAAFLGLHGLSALLPGSISDRLLDRELPSKHYRAAFSVIFGAYCLCLLHRRFISEQNDFGVAISTVTLHQISPWIAVPLVLLWGGLVLYWSRKGKDVPGWLVWATYAWIIVFTFLARLFLDVFSQNIHHGSAYIETIYNVYHGVPFNRITTGIYGHYGLLFAPLLHIFGNGNYSLMCILAGVDCVTAALAIYCVHQVTRENWLRILGSLASCLSPMTMRFANYWQLQPHRVIFTLLVIVYVIHLMKTNRWGWPQILGGFVISTLACIWNTENGLFCTVTMAAAFIVHQWQSEPWYSGRMLLRYCGWVLFILGAMAGAVLAVNVYNFTCGYDQWILKDFFFPLFENRFMEVILKQNMMVENDAWIYVLFLLSGLLLAGLYYTRFCFSRQGLKKQPFAAYGPLLAALGIAGLTNFSYYANRAAYMNLDIISQLACVGMCLLWTLFSSGWTGREHPRKTTPRTLMASLLSASCIAVVAALALQTVLFTPSMLKRKYETGHYDTSGFSAACEALEANIPRDTFAFGAGISLYYNELDWDTVGHYRDMADITVGGSEAVEAAARDALAHDAFVVLHSDGREAKIVNRILELDPSYRLEKELLLNDVRLEYYVRN